MVPKIYYLENKKEEAKEIIENTFKLFNDIKFKNWDFSILKNRLSLFLY